MPTADDILRLRLRRQLIARDAHASSPAEAVHRLLAMQGQDYLGALWSVSLRTGCTEAEVRRALSEGSVVRTWLMRGTLHFVASEDVRWLQRLLGPRVLARAATRHAQLGLTDLDFERAATLFNVALRGGRMLTRAEAMSLLESGGISAEGQRGYHVLWTLALLGLICCGPVRGKEQTFVLLDDWVPVGTPRQDHPSREKAIARLVGRFLEAHGPATLDDIAWWAGLPKGEIKPAMDAAAADLQQIRLARHDYVLPADAERKLPRGGDPEVFLLSGFDEFMLGYTSRDHQLGEHAERYGSTIASNGMFTPTLVVDGRIAGTWKRTLRSTRVDIVVQTFRDLSPEEDEGLDVAAQQYGNFLGLEPHVQTARADK